MKTTYTIPGRDRDEDVRERERDPRDHDRATCFLTVSNCRRPKSRGCDHVLESIIGHLSRRMLEHYSHIRIDAKRQALDALDVQRGRVLPEAGNGNGNGGDPKIEAIIEVPESVTSQSRHSLTLSGSPPSGKLLIPFERRDVRVVEGARLESEAVQRHQATPKRLNAHAISDLTFQNDHSLCVRKPRCSSRF